MSIISRLLGGTQPPAPLPYNEDSAEGLAARWVRWAASIGVDESPIADTTGAHAGLRQPDDVWFLAGTFGGTVERHCTIPAGRRIFLPAFNMWQYPAHRAEPIDLPHAYGELSVDGTPVPLDTVTTGAPFTVSGVRNNPVTGGTRTVTATVWGMWKLLDGLPPGDHTIVISGGDGEGFDIAATYQIVAVPGAAVAPIRHH